MKRKDEILALTRQPNIAEFLLPVLHALQNNDDLEQNWSKGGPRH